MSIETPRLPLTLQRSLGLRGYLPGMRQPAVAATFAVAQRSWPEHALQQLDARLEAALAAYAATPALASLTSQPPLQALVRACTAICAQARMPLFSPARSLPGRSGVQGSLIVQLALPCVGQDHAAMEAMLQWVASAINDTLAAPQRPRTEADDAVALQSTAPLDASSIIATVKASAPQGFNSLGLLLAADEQGIPWQRVVHNVFQFGWGSRSRWMDSSFTDRSSNVGTRIAKNKAATANVLRSAGIPVPKHFRAVDADQAVAMAGRLGYPVVVKPMDCDGGLGVSVLLRDEAAVRRAFDVAREASRAVLVEQHLDGNDYRLQVFAEQVFWAVHRKPGGVNGDGRQTVEQLLAELNADPRRGVKGSGLVLKRIELNDEAIQLLADQDLALNDVPAAGRFVRLRLAANVGNGGTPVPVLDEAHPDNLALGVRAARALRLDVAGVDLLMPDIRRSWLETGAAVCEVNAQPQLSPHLHAWLLARVVEGDGRIPVVAVLGDTDHTAWLQPLLAEAGSSGHGLGWAATQGSFLDGQRITAASAPLQGLGILLADTGCRAALVVLAEESLRQQTLPVDRFDALVLAQSFIAVADNRSRHA